MMFKSLPSLIFAISLACMSYGREIPPHNGTTIPELIRDSVAQTWGYSSKRAQAMTPDTTLERYRNWAFDQIMDGNGTLNVCMRWGVNTTLNQTTRQQIETMFKNQYERWFNWLPGYDNFPFTELNFNVTGWAVSDSHLFEGPDDGFKVYSDFKDKNGAPDCDPGCSRELHQDDNYSGCTGGPDQRFHQFFFINPVWGGFDMGAASGLGVDISYFGWETKGTKLGQWPILLHELGHTFGFPDYITDLKNHSMCDTLWVPPAAPAEFVMMPTDHGAHVPEVTDFDGWTLRYWWTRFSRLRGWQSGNMIFPPPPACEWGLH